MKIGERIVYPQWFTGLAVSMVLLQLGFTGGYISPMLAKLTAPDAYLHLEPDQASWIASLSNLGRFPGAIIGSIFVSFLGSKKGLTVTLVPLALGWLGVAIAWNVEILYAARIFTGAGVGMAYSAFPLYLGEIAMPNIRGALVSMSTCGMILGQLLASFVSSYLELSISFYIYFSLCVILVLVFLWLPESPHHLIKTGKMEAARKSVSWYRCGRGVDEEIKAVEEFVASESSITFVERLREFKKPGIRKATFQVMILFMFMQICGLNSIIFYMELIIIRAKSFLINPADVFIYINIFALFATCSAIYLIDRCGRRFLFLVASIGIMISMLALMAHFILIDENVDVTNLQWLPIVSLILYMVTSNMGLLPVPSTVLSETFPSNVKCIAATIASFVGGLVAFLSTKTFQPLVDLMGESYVFLLYAIFAALIIPYTLFVMPETKGKTLQQIQDDLMRKS